MLRCLYFLTVLVLAMLPAHNTAHAFTAADAFASAPGDMTLLLDAPTRLDMLDYFRSGQSTPSVNMAGGASRILSESDLKLTFANGDHVDYQVCVLPAGRDSLIMVVETLRGGVVDSKAKVYTKGWVELDKKSPIPTLKLADWLTKQGKADRREVEDFLPFIAYEATYEPSNQTLTLRLSMDAFFTKADQERLARWLKPQITLRWNGKKFTLADA